jgi:hypothetical protein
MESFPISLTPIGELLDHLPWVPVVRRFLGARAELDAIVFRLIYARRAQDRREGESETKDVLGMLLAAGDGEGGMDVEQIRDEVMTIFLAGHETTAMALTWTFWLLAQSPDVEQRLRTELARVLAGRLPTMDDVPALRYTRDVIAESMRLYPPAWVVGRRAVEDAPLGEWTAQGLDRDHEPVDHPPRPPLLARAPSLPARALVERRDRRPAEVRLLPLRRRHPGLHRRGLRLDRTRPGPRHDRPPLDLHAHTRPRIPHPPALGHPPPRRPGYVVTPSLSRGSRNRRLWWRPSP